ncbi:hypothetical protein DACRYDRAFT_117074 [Dacryopinax primogenitus]|uniref:S-adenosyl-L-methionine-dependent methyltransferase n=1 Tax=Dacryopinax primogenitus (strain DJM 731) TaxID=1858805 RepID=M5FSV1_DACPD|nr:uncharacterized protein DACRYDRAFT_117074 [Dacryopinax primogenitus]EJU00586.1 hypothetical protein DACRYDRAFT_117074 [Dacryopinax primogenitus]
MSNMIYEQQAEGGSAESLTTIGSGEEGRWYMERYGRQFHVMDALWPYPHDDDEMERQVLQHDLLRKVVGHNFVGPVPIILANTPQRPVKRVLDVGSGTGRWLVFFSASPVALSELTYKDRVQQMAEMFPHEYQTTTASGRNLAAEAPAFFQWFETIRIFIRTRLGLDMNTPQRLPQILHEKGFRSINTRAHTIPIGPWAADPVGKQLGEMNCHVWLEFLNTTRPMLMEVRKNEQQVDRLIAGVRTLLEELPQGVRLLSRYHTIWALRGQSRLVNEKEL